jgi:hypothetical protein
LEQSPNRVSPLFTPVSIAATVLFLVLFAGITWVQGGLGFSPGPVSAKAKPGVEISGLKAMRSLRATAGCAMIQPAQPS